MQSIFLYLSELSKKQNNGNDILTLHAEYHSYKQITVQDK